jgi:hypothetical protein
MCDAAVELIQTFSALSRSNQYAVLLELARISEANAGPLSDEEFTAAGESVLAELAPGFERSVTGYDGASGLVAADDDLDRGFKGKVRIHRRRATTLPSPTASKPAQPLRRPRSRRSPRD